MIKARTFFFRGRKEEVLMNVNGTLDFSINSAMVQPVVIYIYMNVVPLWILNEKNYEEISANAQFLFMTDGEREDHCCNSRRKCFWEDIFFQITWKNDIPDDIRDSTKLLKKNNFSSFWPFVNWHSTSRNVNRIVKNKMWRGGRWRHNFDTYIINV